MCMYILGFILYCNIRLWTTAAGMAHTVLTLDLRTPNRRRLFVLLPNNSTTDCCNSRHVMFNFIKPYYEIYLLFRSHELFHSPRQMCPSKVNYYYSFARRAHKCCTAPQKWIFTWKIIFLILIFFFVWTITFGPKFSIFYLAKTGTHIFYFIFYRHYGKQSYHSFLYCKPPILTFYELHT